MQRYDFPTLCTRKKTQKVYLPLHDNKGRKYAGGENDNVDNTYNKDAALPLPD